MATCRDRLGAFLQALRPDRATGVYVNFLDSDDDTGRVREAYGDRIYRRLAEVKAKYELGEDGAPPPSRLRCIPVLTPAEKGAVSRTRDVSSGKAAEVVCVGRAVAELAAAATDRR